MSVCFDHAKHAKSFAAKLKDSKTQKGPTIAQDDDCQCALHLQMNHVLLPESLAIEFPVSTLINNETPHPKAMTYRCLLDYFSSRAPPFSFAAVA
ncbi:hypothetical protein VUJ46_21315 [Chryseobacterium sp. MYb264]|uniref:hypothetical protein n=1 Tax=Chryseobacterium sp. MYb264 TaxID=2745153 RepID=UPI002E12D8A7|nr:hypothetical protein VUJ46_21315 [Chryseobacterium sp. MYb264]